MPNNDTKVKTSPPQKSSHISCFVKCLITAAVVVAALIACIMYFNVYRPRGKGPAGPAVPAEPFQNVWSEKKVLLLGIGDCITSGSGAREGFSYFERLAKNPPGDSPDMSDKNLSVVLPNLTIQNVASSGSNSIDHYVVIESLRKQPQDVLGIVVMTTGGNDLIRGYGKRPPEEGAMFGATIEQALPWMDNFQKRLDDMVTLLKSFFPGGCHIFLANIYDPTDGTGDASAWLTKLPAWPEGLSILEGYNRIISQYADTYDNVHLVDIHKAFLGHGIHCRKFWLENYDSNDPTYWYYLNIEDPSERGHDAIRRLFLNEMIKVFYDVNDRHAAQ